MIRVLRRNGARTEAHKQFQTLVNKYPHTRSADFGHYFMGVTSASLGDNGAAERE